VTATAAAARAKAQEALKRIRCDGSDGRDGNSMEGGTPLFHGGRDFQAPSAAEQLFRVRNARFMVGAALQFPHDVGGGRSRVRPADGVCCDGVQGPRGPDRPASGLRCSSVHSQRRRASPRYCSAKRPSSSGIERRENVHCVVRQRSADRRCHTFRSAGFRRALGGQIVSLRACDESPPDRTSSTSSWTLERTCRALALSGTEGGDCDSASAYFWRISACANVMTRSSR